MSENTIIKLKREYVILFVIFAAFSGNITKSIASADYHFKHYNINNGLSQNTVHSILQDKTGFMWFGTKDGLNRFDGTSFKIFRFSPEGDLHDNVFHHILEDKNGNIWVATEGGIYIYDPRVERFNRFNVITDNNESVDGWISDFVQDTDGDIWISVEEKGVFHYNFITEKLIFYPVSVAPDGMRMISLCAGKNNDIWVFPYGLPVIHIDKKTGKTSEFQLEDDPYFFYNLGEARNIITGQYNQLLIPTSDKGLVSINTVNKTHRILLDKDVSGNPIFARTVKRIDDQTIWVGTESGVYIINREEESVLNLRHDNSMLASLSDNAIYSIYKDREGGVWVGSYFGGVDYYSDQLNNFELFYPIPGINNLKGARIREFYSAVDGRIWIGTEDNGLHLFDPEKNTFLPLPTPLKSLYNNIHALYADSDYLWISTYTKGLNKYDLKTQKMVTYTHSDDTTSISQNSVFALHKDRQNALWVATLSGLNIYNYEDDNFTRIEKLRGLALQDIFEDNSGRIWVSTFSDGLYRYNPATKEWKVFTYDENNSYSLPYNKVTSVFEDTKNRLWITTQGGGFSLFNEETETFTIFNTTNGMPNDVVYQIVEDNESNLWLSTNSGLVRYNPQTGVFNNYTVYNGLRTNQFNYKSSYKTSDGVIYFGSVDGFVRFNPSSFKGFEHQIPIIFTELSINNYTVNPADEKSLLKQSILYTDTLTLPHNKNSFRLQYAVLTYSDLNANHILYKLEGFDKDWINAKGKQEIVYSNLTPGKYVLNIKLNKDENNAYSENIKTLVIRIRPPFWASRWAFLLYVLLLIFGIMILLRYLKFRNQRIQKQKMRIFEQQKERELYQSKIDFFTNVAHEIRTPLSLIKAPLDHVIMTESVSDNVKDNLQIMSKNTDRLLNLTNQLLDFRKTESEAYLLNVETQNVSELIRETFLRFSPLATQRKMLLELDLPETDIVVPLDKEAFLKIISNLLDNAIKYGDSFVRLNAYTTNNNEFHLIIENDGNKIPERFKEEIFKPFVYFDKEKDQKITGTGIGLALSRSLAELHKGNLYVEDNENNICFHLTLPVRDIKRKMASSPEKTHRKKKSETVIKAASTHTILLVDDDVELLQFEEKFLSPHYTILLAENGKQALEILRDTNVNLVVSDVMMPEMDGFELTQRIKSDIEFSHIPVILLTAKVNVQSKVQGFETGADAYIDKPFSLEVLMARIANLLQNREKLREVFLKHPFIGVNSMALTKSDEEFIVKLHKIVHDNLDNSEFIVEDIAEMFNMSRASFYRKIKGVLDLTPNEYIRVERLKKSAQLLKEGNYKVNEICYMIGFNSPSYFSKCFQQQFGVLPKDFV